MPSRHLYDYPRLYDIAFGWDLADELAFINERFNEAALGWPLRIYEPFCGNGRLAIPLARAGHQVIGLDNNPAMIEFARRRAVAEGVHVDFQLGQAQHWEPTEPVDIVFCMMDSFRHLTTEPAATTALTHFHQTLRPGGLLLLGVNVGEPPIELNEHHHWEMERDGTLISTAAFDLRQPGFTPGTSLMRIAMHVVESDGQSYDVVSDYEMRRYTRASIQAAVQAVGAWRERGMFDYYELAPAEPTQDTGNLVFVYEKLADTALRR
jgi:SAM-dependent methyltransferase